MVTMGRSLISKLLEIGIPIEQKGKTVAFGIFKPCFFIAPFRKQCLLRDEYSIVCRICRRGNASWPSSFRVVLSSSPDIRSGPFDIADLLLSAGYSNIKDHRTILQVDGVGRFVIWVVQVAESSPWTVRDGLSYATRFLQKGTETSMNFLFTADRESEDNLDTRKTYLVSILKLCAKSSESISISYQERQALKENSIHYDSGREKRSLLRFKGFFFAGFIVVIVILALVFIVLSIKYSEDRSLWMRWETTGSEGPRYQLQFTQPWHEYSEWAAQSPSGNTEWFVRIDDQSMIPPHLVDETELRYQQWFRQRYPEIERVRLSGDYLNRSFFEDPFAVQIPSDRLFHPAHCILSLRRYWQAKETGKHICPRDIDHKHVKHCLDSLDDFVFIGGLRGSKRAASDVDNTTLPWIINACF